MVLDPEARPWLIKAALMHDLGEKYTGDTPAPFKRVLRADKVLDEEYEKEYLRSKGIDVEQLDGYDRQMLKTADLLDLCYKCVDEIELGNRKVESILENGLEYLGGIQWHGVVAERLVDIVQHLRTRLLGVLLINVRLMERITRIIDINTGTSSPTTASTISKDKSPNT